MIRRLVFSVTAMLLGWALGQAGSPYAPSPYVAVSGEALALRPDGGFVVAGVRREPAAEGGVRPGADLFLAWLDATGALERLVVFGGEGDERLGSVALDDTGAVCLAGSTTGTLPGATGEGAQFVAKLAPAGEVAWVRQWHGGADAYPAVVALAADGELLVAGSTATGEGAEGFFRDPGFHPY